MPYVFKTMQSNGEPHRNWRYQYTDWTGRRRGATGTASKRETEMIALRVQDKQDKIRKGHAPPPNTAIRHKNTAFSEVKDKYITWGESQGGTGGRPWGEGHAAMRRAHLDWWQERLGLEIVGDLYNILSKVEGILQQLKAERGLSSTTLQRYAGAIRAFCNWAVKRRYLAENPLAELAPYDTTPTEKRRALSFDEIPVLLEACDEKRCPCYELALCSGLRASELRKLKVKHLDPEKGGLILGNWTKNREASFQPLARRMIDRLRELSAGKDGEEELVYVPSHTARDLDKDLEAAGIPKKTEAGKAIFHSLRYTYATMLDQLGASEKEQEVLVRHVSSGLTLLRYTRPIPERIGKLVEEVGEIVLRDNKSTTGAQWAQHEKDKILSFNELQTQGPGFESRRPDHSPQIIRTPPVTVRT